MRREAFERPSFDAITILAMPRFIPNDRPNAERPRCFVSGKTMFADENEAREEADRIRGKNGTELDVYLCMSCDHWHFTSSSR